MWLCMVPSLLDMRSRKLCEHGWCKAGWVKSACCLGDIICIHSLVLLCSALSSSLVVSVSCMESIKLWVATAIALARSPKMFLLLG